MLVVEIVWRTTVLQRSAGVAGCPCLSPVHLQLPPWILATSSCPGSHPCPLVPCLDVVVQLLTFPHTVPSPHTPWSLVRLSSDGCGLPSVPNYVQRDISLNLKEVTFLGRSVPFTVCSLSSPPPSASLQTFWDTP